MGINVAFDIVDNTDDVEPPTISINMVAFDNQKPEPIKSDPKSTE